MSDDSSSTDRARVLQELDRLKRLAQQLSIDDLRRGDWLAHLLKHALGPYTREVDRAYLAAKYPGLPAEAVVRARIRLAARYAGAEGALSAGAYTGAVAATLGSGGSASPLTLPAAGLSFVLDLLYLSAAQLRLAHDIAVLYGVPLDLDDPEDLWKLIRIAFAVKGEVAGRSVLSKGIPALVRPLGRRLFERNLAKFSLPAVGVPLSAALNHRSVTTAAASAVRVLRSEGRIVDAARRMTAGTTSHTELLWVLWLIVKSDALIQENERLLLKHVTALVGDLDREAEALAGLSSTLDVTPQTMWSRLSAATGDLPALYEAGVVAAAVDGRINVNELTNLAKLADCCGVPFDEAAIRRAAREQG